MSNASSVAISPIPNRDRLATSAADRLRPDVKIAVAGAEGMRASAGPTRSTTRRAIAGAGSMNFAGQSANQERVVAEGVEQFQELFA